jgi:hypothetical protein
MTPAPEKSSYMPVIEQPFETVFKRMSGGEAAVMKRQMDLLLARYDLADRPAAGVTMSRGKAIPDGVRVRLGSGAGAWEPGPLHGRIPGAARLPAGAQARRLRPARSGEVHPADQRGQALFFGKAQCATCHQPPYYTDNLMHNLRTERFYKPVMINGRMAAADGPIKTFPLRGIKDTPPYLHDGRLLTLDDSVEFFGLVLGIPLTAAEKKDLVAFLRAL